MRIRSLSIRNYKCHKSVDSVPFRGLTTIIGENDSGKTALIDFLEIMLTGALPKPDDYYRSVHSEGTEAGDHEVVEEEISGEIVFELDDNEEIALSDLVDQGQTLRLKRVFSRSNDVAYVFARKFDDPRLHSYESLKADELKDLLSSLGLEDQKNQELRKATIRHHIEHGNPASSFDWVETPFSKLKPHLPKLIRYNVDDYKNPSSMIFKVLQEVFENELYSKREDGTRELKSETLAEVLGQVRSKVVEAAQQFKTYAQRYNDRITDITIEPDIDLSTGLKSSPIKVKDETGLFTYLDSRGFGTRKRMFMAIFEWNREVVAGMGQGYTVRCYDEPDNSLHIDAQRKLYKTVKAIVDGGEGKSQVVVCTHSLFMIDAAPANSINLVKRNEVGSTSIEYLDTFGDEAVQEFVELMCREMGLPNSHIFFEKCFIILEGQTEANFLPLAYRKLHHSAMSEDGITMVNLDGNGAAVNFLKLLMRNKKYLTLVFLDTDTTDFRKKKVLSAHNKLLDGMSESDYAAFVDDFFANRVMFVGTREFEDTFSDDVLARVLNAVRPKSGGVPWRVGEIQSIRVNSSKFSQGLTGAVAQQCGGRYLSKPELGTHLGQHVAVSEVPSQVRQLFEKARSIAGVS